MPLFHSHSFEGFGFGGYGNSAEHCLGSGQRHKRKMETDWAECSEMSEISDMKDEDSSLRHYKRQCQWSDAGHHLDMTGQNEVSGHLVAMEDDRLGDSPQHLMVDCCPKENQETAEAAALMDSDRVSPPPSQPGSSSHGPGTPTTPQNILSDSLRRCGFKFCRGLKPSPVSGRLYCHCSASWRGMYGIDTGYITDYY